MALMPVCGLVFALVLGASEAVRKVNRNAGLILSNLDLKGRYTNDSFVRYVTGSSIRYAIDRELAYLTDIDPKYMFAAYIESDWSKAAETQSFSANMPVDVHLVLDGHHDHGSVIAGQGFTATGEYMRYSDGNTRVDELWPVYRKSFDTGHVRFKLNFGHPAGIFVTAAFQLGLVPTNIVSGGKHGAPVHLRLVSGTHVKWSSIRNWNLTEIDPKYMFAAFFEGDYLMDTAPHSFVVNHPVDVVIAMDGRADHKNASPLGFHASGEFIRVADGDYPTHFPLYKKSFGVGQVSFSFREEIKAGIFAVRSPE